MASIVSTANRLWDGWSGIESQRGQILHTRPDRPWDPPGLLYNGHRVSFPGVRRLGRGGDQSPPSSVNIKERFPSRPSRSALGRTLRKGLLLDRTVRSLQCEKVTDDCVFMG
jgi:hypothetical protein